MDDGAAVDGAAVAELVSDLHWQVEQFGPRGIKDQGREPVQPVLLQKRGLTSAINRGGLAVAEYVRSYLYKDASDGFRKLRTRILDSPRAPPRAGAR